MEQTLLILTTDEGSTAYLLHIDGIDWGEVNGSIFSESDSPHVAMLNEQVLPKSEPIEMPHMLLEPTRIVTAMLY